MRALLLFITGAAVLSAQPLSQGERDRLLSELYSTKKMFVDSVAGRSAAQWNFKAAPDRWSIAECAEHIALTEDMLWNTITGEVMKTPADPSKKAEVSGREQQITKSVADRSNKAQAPEPLKPSGKFGTPQAAVDHFTASRDRALDYIRSTPDELRVHFMKAPTGDLLDAWQWFFFMTAHTDRHVQQIQEVKGAPGYR